MSETTRVIDHLGRYGYLNQTCDKRDMIKCLNRAMGVVCRDMVKKAMTGRDKKFTDKITELQQEIAQLKTIAANIKSSSAKTERGYCKAAIARYFSKVGGADRDSLFKLIEKSPPGTGHASDFGE